MQSSFNMELLALDARFGHYCETHSWSTLWNTVDTFPELVSIDCPRWGRHTYPQRAYHSHSQPFQFYVHLGAVQRGPWPC